MKWFGEAVPLPRCDRRSGGAMCPGRGHYSLINVARLLWKSSKRSEEIETEIGKGYRKHKKVNNKVYSDLALHIIERNIF